MTVGLVLPKKHIFFTLSQTSGQRGINVDIFFHSRSPSFVILADRNRQLQPFMISCLKHYKGAFTRAHHFSELPTAVSSATVSHRLCWHRVPQAVLAPCPTGCAGTVSHRPCWHRVPQAVLAPCPTGCAGTVSHRLC